MKYATIRKLNLTQHAINRAKEILTLLEWEKFNCQLKINVNNINISNQFHNIEIKVTFSNIILEHNSKTWWFNDVEEIVRFLNKNKKYAISFSDVRKSNKASWNLNAGVYDTYDECVEANEKDGWRGYATIFYQTVS